MLLMRACASRALYLQASRPAKKRFVRSFDTSDRKGVENM